MTKSPRKRLAEEPNVPQTAWGEEKTSPKRVRHDADKSSKRLKAVVKETDDQDPVPEPLPAPHMRPDPPEQIAVSAASLKTVGRLWPNQSKEEEQGTVRWNHFQAAMNDIGLHASPAQGSKILFDGERGKILIHCPHGSGNVQLPREYLLTYGKRLSNKWGWGYGTFVQKEK